MNWILEYSQRIEDKLKQIPGWAEAKPVILGSLARNELCPQSDLDLLFLGDEEKAAVVVRALQTRQLEGHKVRARVPLNKQDWTEGVESKDVLALLNFKTFSAELQALAQKQKEQILIHTKLKKEIFRTLLRERKERALRFDSLNNFLEPNLKQSPGGLRDIDQALQVLQLLDPEGKIFAQQEHAKEALLQCKELLLRARFELHRLGFQDHLVASEQKEISEKLGYKTSREFMKAVSLCFSRAHFYSDWIFSFLRASKAKRKGFETQNPKTPQDLMRGLRADSSILQQQVVRIKMDTIHKTPISNEARGLLLREAILFRSSDELTKAVFQSRWIGKLCPLIKPLMGYVQHDQYHRLTAEAHLLQAVREVKRVWRSARSLGKLRFLHRGLSARDWEILSWTALYHDIAKGQSQDSPTSHSDLGERWARAELKAFGLKADLIEEVSFLVRHHLQLSVAAFRKNPTDPKTWKEFFALGFDAKRISLLALFTVIDIRATNIEAWTDWKSNLLAECVQSLLHPEKQEFYNLTQNLLAQFSLNLGESLDPGLVHYFSKSVIEKDLLRIKRLGASGSGPQVQILRDRKKKVWIRFRSSQDQLGLVALYVRSMYVAGISVQQALIQTLPEVGVYDLFQISSVKAHGLSQLVKRLELILNSQDQDTTPPTVRFSEIEVVSQSDIEVILSFRGADQRGLLWALAAKLQQAGISIVSARVHTWGGQIEDLIHIKPHPQLDSLIAKWRAE